MSSAATTPKEAISSCLFELTRIDHERRALKKGGSISSSAIALLRNRCEKVYKTLEVVAALGKSQTSTKEFALVVADHREQCQKIEKLGKKHLPSPFSSTRSTMPPSFSMHSPQTSKEEEKREPRHIGAMRVILDIISKKKDIQIHMLSFEETFKKYADQIFEQVFILEQQGKGKSGPSLTKKQDAIANGRAAFLGDASDETRFKAAQNTLNKAISELDGSQDTELPFSLPPDIDSEDDQPLGQKEDDPLGLDLDFTSFSVSPKPLPASQGGKQSSSFKAIGDDRFTQFSSSLTQDTDSEDDQPLGQTDFSFSRAPSKTLPRTQKKKPSSSSTTSSTSFPTLMSSSKGGVNSTTSSSVSYPTISTPSSFSTSTLIAPPDAHLVWGEKGEEWISAPGAVCQFTYGGNSACTPLAVSFASTASAMKPGTPGEIGQILRAFAKGANGAKFKSGINYQVDEAVAMVGEIGKKTIQIHEIWQFDGLNRALGIQDNNMMTSYMKNWKEVVYGLKPGQGAVIQFGGYTLSVRRLATSWEFFDSHRGRDLVTVKGFSGQKLPDGAYIKRCSTPKTALGYLNSIFQGGPSGAQLDDIGGAQKMFAEAIQISILK